jgi:hypothetical protein
MKVYCETCKAETYHNILKEFKKSFNEDWGFGDNIWQIIKCKGCDTTSFRHDWFCSEDDNGRHEILYPERGKHFLPIKDFNKSFRKTRIVRRIYREVINSFNNKSYTLCAVGIRAIIEGVCKIENIKSGLVNEKQQDGTFICKRKKNLEGKIAGLVENDLITRKYLNYLHDLRFMGNEAVHELEEPSSEELKHAIKIVENLLENLYEISETAAELNELMEDKKILKSKK